MNNNNFQCPVGTLIKRKLKGKTKQQKREEVKTILCLGSHHCLSYLRKSVALSELSQIIFHGSVSPKDRKLFSSESTYLPSKPRTQSLQKRVRQWCGVTCTQNMAFAKGSGTGEPTAPVSCPKPKLQASVWSIPADGYIYISLNFTPGTHLPSTGRAFWKQGVFW